jgi:uncharacterized membrane protein YdbT with pleckstrin-like domain
MVFSLNPSQWINFGWLIFGIIGIPLVLPPLMFIYRIIYVSCWSYEFYDGFIIEQKGVFTIDRTEVNLHRIKSIKLVQPFLYRFVGLYNIHIISSDPFKPFFNLTAIPIGQEMVNAIKEQIHLSRTKHGLKEYDIHTL